MAAKYPTSAEIEAKVCGFAYDAAQKYKRKKNSDAEILDMLRAYARAYVLSVTPKNKDPLPISDEMLARALDLYRSICPRPDTTDALQFRFL